MKVFVLSAGLLLGVAVWWLTYSRGVSNRPVTGESEQPAVISGDSPPAAPRALLKRRVDPPPFANAVPAAEPAAPTPPEAKPELTVADQRMYLQTRFAAQKVDAGWASTARQELSDDMARFSDKDVRLQGVECRSSLCRAELTLASHDAGVAFMETWVRKRVWVGPGFAANDETNPDGSGRMTIFLGRPGTELPYLE